MYLREQMTNPCTQGRRATQRLVFFVFSVYVPAEGMEKRQQGMVAREVLESRDHSWVRCPGA